MAQSTTSRTTSSQTWDVDRAASVLLACEDERTDRTPITDEWPELDLATAYAVQDETLRRRLARGERLVGVKLGLTSRAKQRRMGIDTPLVAWLTDAMILPAGEPVPQATLIHPRVEPEIIFVLGERLEGPGVTAAQALSAVDRVYGGAEVIDSRYTDFRFTLPDVVADNASSGAFVTGPVGVRPDGLDLALEAVLVEVDGAVVDSATGAAVQGNPAEALALAVNDLGRARARAGGRLDRAHRRDDRRRLRPARGEHRLPLHHPRLGLRQRRQLMPLIEVTLVAGRSPEQLRTLIHELHEATVRAVGAPPESVRVVLREVPATHWAAGDVTIAERRAGQAGPRTGQAETT